MSDIVERLIKIADASRRADGSDIPLGAEIRRSVAEIQRLRDELASARAENAELRKIVEEGTAFMQGVPAQIARALTNARAEAFERAAQILIENHTVVAGEPLDPAVPDIAAAIRAEATREGSEG